MTCTIENTEKNPNHASNECAVLQQQAQEYKLICDNVDIGIIKSGLGEDYTVEFINARALAMLGYTRELFRAELADKITGLLLADDVAAIQKDLTTAAAPIQFKLRGKHRSGKTIWFWGTAVATKDEDGRKIGIYSLYERATDPLMGDTLSKTEALIDKIAGGVELCLYEENFTIIHVSDGLTALTGYSREELLYSHHTDLMLAEDLSFLRSEIDRQCKINGNYSLEYRIKRKDGEIIWIVDKGHLLSLNNHKKMVQCIILDITKNKEIEEAFKISEKRYEIAMGFSNVTVFDYNVVTKQMIHHWSDVEQYHLPKIMENAVETFVESGMLVKSSIEDFREMYRKIESGAPNAHAIIRTLNADGTEKILEFHLTAIFDANGKTVRAIGVKKDITEKISLQKEKQYGDTFAFGKRLTYEANISKDTVISYDPEWAAELGLTDISTFSGLVSSISRVISPRDLQNFRKHLSISFILSAYQNHQNLVSFEYRKNVLHQGYQWYAKSLNIIKEQTTGDIIVRCYITNINERKEKELRALSEQRYYEVMLSKSAIIYEINLSKNVVISGYENLNALLDIQRSSSYTEMITDFCTRAIHPEDSDGFLALYTLENVIECYHRGKNDLVCEYRRLDEDGAFIWVRCTMHVFEDVNSGDLKGFACIEDIDEEKRKELELVYKSQHDLLTGFYNKATVEEKINKLLSSAKGKSFPHVFFIIDLDYFKSINDTFGHAFGDAVLSQTSSKINALFRDDDILGRIGGDEFVILMKNVQDDRIALLKAQEICDSVKEVYVHNGRNYGISASIGIAFYSRHGKTYDALYNHSDAALYNAKAHGRNRFSVYDGTMSTDITNVHVIDQSSLSQTRKFEENISDYVFRILYESSDKHTAIHAVLALVGNHYNISRVYVFEDCANGTHTSNTFEWCAKGTPAQIDCLQNIPYKSPGNYRYRFNADGIYYVSDISSVPDDNRESLETKGVKSMIQVSLMKNNRFIGFIGFDRCDRLHVPSKNELWDCRSISNILGMFIMEMRAIEEIEAAKNVALSIVNGLDSYSYVCDPDTYEILFINEKTLELVPNANIGAQCYRSFWNRSEPCDDCPMQSLKESSQSKYTAQLYNTHLNIWIKVTALWIDWMGNKRACLVDSMDITAYRRKV